ncbi:autotransporter outer membrane beta-barrel domain-containing protein [Telmatospirillum siberiense]|uniref:Autotransporter domain-containing protein n=1 Tax=Telmatospirillum siberiense TaxID=382514 RepID=A0A2N3PWA8_9PROT|nr:autotransporter outer membrane beta-barrel domain-containing protein [Telmatospirillum siberiense]PKU24689.1 hypothetical protein CWS72_10140 [Telmatospirillum siberiense]
MKRNGLLAGASVLAVLAGMAPIDVAWADCSGSPISGSTGGCTWNSGDLSITSTGTISGEGTGVKIDGSIGQLTNSGTISGSHVGIAITVTSTIISTAMFTSWGTIGTLSNSGTITGGTYAIYNIGSIGTITNSGVIAGNILNTNANPLTIDGGGGGAIGTLTGYAAGSKGVITNTASDLIFASGNLLLNDDINVGSHTVTNSGAALALSTIVTVSGNYTQTAGTLALDGSGELVVSGYASITGGTVVAGLASSGNYLVGETETLISASSGSSYSDASVTSGLTGLAVSADTISGTNLVVGYLNDYIGGSIATLSNGGTISGTTYGLYVASSGSLGGLVNSGTISGAGIGVNNGGGIGTITNSGTISGGTGVYNGGGIGTLSNSGILSGSRGFNNGGSIDAVTNSGLVHGGHTGIWNSGSIGTLINSGTISGSIAAINNFSYTANSATVIGSIGVITNSGVIAGNIINDTSNALTIDGGSGSVFGTLSGYAADTAGTITSTLSNLTFASGNLWLDDDINVGAYSVINSGATLKLTNSRTITGSYNQTGGGLVIGVASAASYGNLRVTGSATVTGASITISGVSLSAGEIFSIVKAGTSGTYSNDSVTVTGTSGLKASTSTIGNTLEVTLVSGSSSSSSSSSSPGAYAALGRTAGGAASGVGAALDAIAASTSATALAFQNNVLVPLNTLAGAEQAAAVKQLAPSQITPATQVAAQTEPVVQAIETHQLTLNDGNGATGMAAGSAVHPYGLWGQMLGGYSLRGATAGADGAKSSDFGLMSGLDFHADADTTVGAALSWLRGWSAGLGASSGSFTTADSYQLTAYGLYRFGPAFLDGQVGVGYDSFNQRRSIGFLGQQAHADYDGQHYLAKISGGYDIPVNSLTLTPMVGLRFLRAVSDGYRENGSADDLTIRRRGSQSLTQDLGVKVGWAVATLFGALTPEAHLAWVHDYAQGPIATSGLMGGEAFTSTVARTAADGARLTLSATLAQSDSLTLKAEYEGEERPAYQSHSGLLKATWSF